MNVNLRDISIKLLTGYLILLYFVDYFTSLGKSFKIVGSFSHFDCLFVEKKLTDLPSCPYPTA